jgi:hypothetical protein
MCKIQFREGKPSGCRIIVVAGHTVLGRHSSLGFQRWSSALAKGGYRQNNNANGK